MDKVQKEEIRDLGLNSIADFFKINIDTVENLPAAKIHVLIQKARLGMQFEKEMGVGTRAEERNTLRVLTLVATDKEELRRLITKSLPQYAPK